MLDLKALDEIVKNAAALRVIAELEPIGGRNSRIFPPTYLGRKYAEIKDSDGKTVGVVLDSPQSQANRMESLLEDEIDAGTLSLPRIVVDLGDDLRQLGRVGKISSLLAPHRWADAILRDAVSRQDGKPFHKTEMYEKMAGSNLRDASAVLAFCPTSLLFGVWDSHNANINAGRAFKCQRHLISEITAYGIQRGMAGGVRRDPVGIVGELPSGDFQKSEYYGGLLKSKKEKTPAALGHGSVPFLGKKADKHGPANEMAGGGIIADKIVLSSVISLSGLRQLGFGDNEKNFDDGEKNKAGRAVLAALGIFAIAKQNKAGYSLRSRCELSAPSSPEMKVVPDAEDGWKQSLDVDDARELLKKAIERVKKADLKWGGDFEMKAMPEFQTIVEKSLAAKDDSDR